MQWSRAIRHRPDWDHLHWSAQVSVIYTIRLLRYCSPEAGLLYKLGLSRHLSTVINCTVLHNMVGTGEDVRRCIISGHLCSTCALHWEIKGYWMKDAAVGGTHHTHVYHIPRLTAVAARQQQTDCTWCRIICQLSIAVKVNDRSNDGWCSVTDIHLLVNRRR